MKEFLEKYLKKTITIAEEQQLFNKLPLQYKGRYHLYKASLGGHEWIIAVPKSKTVLADLRRDQKQISCAAGLDCVLYLEAANAYARKAMLEEGIPFIVEGKQIYMPFLGLMSSETAARTVGPVRKISFLTQKLILTAIYEKWSNVNVTEAARLLGVSKMSASRCFDEMEYLQVPLIAENNGRRNISAAGPAKETWEEVKEFMVNPVIRRFELTEDIGLQFRAGLSALAELSLLSENECPVYGVLKKDLAKNRIKDIRQAGWQDEKKSIVLELGYIIDFQGKGVMDPLSIALCLTGDELEDARINSSIQEMLEEYVW